MKMMTHTRMFLQTNCTIIICLA